MIKITDLPEELYRVLQGFLSKDDYHYFLNTSKLYFQQLKKRTIHFALNTIKSVQYAQDPTFQQLLLQLVANGWKQISLSFANQIPENEFPITLPYYSIRTIGFGIRENRFHAFSHIECIKGIVEFERLPASIVPNVKELTIYSGHTLKSFNHLQHLRSLTFYGIRRSDLSPLQNIPNLALFSCNLVKDFSMFDCKKQSSLLLYLCHHLISVHNFRGIHRLVLDSCTALVDVTPLHGIYDLTLKDCPLIQDISGLGGHYSLLIDRCSEDLIGYESLLHISKVDLSKCNIQDLNVLRFTKHIALRECPKAVDYTPLNTAKSIYIQINSKESDISMLTNLNNLTIDKTYQGKIDLPILKNYKLTLMNFLASYPLSSSDTFGNQLNLMHFSGVRELNLSKCDEIVQLIIDQGVEFLPALQKLVIISRKVLVNVNGLGTISTLYLVFCDKLIDISGLGRGNHTVVINHCYEIEDVSSLAHVPVVRIQGRIKARDLSCLANVPRLKVLPR